MTVTIEHEQLRVTVSDDTVVTLDDALELVRAALLAIGYHPDNVFGALGD